MAQMYQDMYGAVGRFGNKTFYQRRGKTIARIRTKPKNPRSDGQTRQRVLMKAICKTYGKLKEICNHSFEGYITAVECYDKFKKVNYKFLRERAVTLEETGQGLGQFYQFAPLKSEKWTPFAAIIAQGHLPEISVGIDPAGSVAYVFSPGPTYEDFVSAWDLQRGDLLTFVTVQKRDDKYEVHFARIVLDPRKSDGSGAPMSTEIVNSEGEFPYSNREDELKFSRFEFDTDHLNFVLDQGGTVVAAGIIVSRKDDSDEWFHSNCQLMLNEVGLGADLCSLEKAVEKSYAADKINVESELYLNNADAEDNSDRK